MKRYGKYIRPYLFSFIVGPLLMIVEVLGEIVLPKLMAEIINKGVAERNVPYIINVGIVMVIFAFMMMAGGIGGAYFGAKASIGFAADLRKDAFSNIQKFSFSNIDKYSTGSLVTRITNDVTQVQNLINMMLRMMLRAPGMLIGAVIMAFTINASLAKIIVFIIPVLVCVVAVVLKIGFPRFKALQNKIDGLNSNIRESLTNVRVIKSFVRDDYEQKKFEANNEDLKDAALSAFRVMITTWPLMGLAMNATTLAVVWYGGNQVIAGTMQIGDLTAFITYVTQILFALLMTSMIILQSSRAVASAKRINEVLDEKTDIDDAEAARPDKVVESGSIEFRNVKFRYYKNSQDPVLDDISLKINSGETVGIIGSTGSGKSTLVQLIPRLYDPDEGEVFVDGVNVKDYSLNNLREGVSMVLQKNVLFSGSIIENLQWGDEFADTETIEAAAKMAEAHGFVTSFAEGYETDLGQGGVNVSGGQKQRLCIARAMLKKPKILILDDSTSAVDTATEAKIRASLKSSLPDATKIIIAQRISSIIEADKIAVIDDGRIVGWGSHAELMEACEAYKEIYYSQMDKEVGA
ncbi:MAG: ABC transporter ATP-binding protein/permease [Lachnospiraceae bacterium]|nr:ABC transporter ATP-binding protein/permease [Lachnospiraceae bacterium]